MKHCEFQSGYRPDVKRHSDRVHEEVKYFCKHCDFQSGHEDVIRRHTDRVHNGVKYSCVHCDFQSGHWNSIIKHEKKMHSMKSNHQEINNQPHSSEVPFGETVNNVVMSDFDSLINSLHFIKS